MLFNVDVIIRTTQIKTMTNRKIKSVITAKVKCLDVIFMSQWIQTKERLHNYSAVCSGSKTRKATLEDYINTIKKSTLTPSNGKMLLKLHYLVCGQIILHKEWHVRSVCQNLT